jgi:hypothetical protein
LTVWTARDHLRKAQSKPKFGFEPTHRARTLYRSFVTGNPAGTTWAQLFSMLARACQPGSYWLASQKGASLWPLQARLRRSPCSLGPLNNRFHLEKKPQKGPSEGVTFIIPSVNLAPEHQSMAPPYVHVYYKHPTRIRSCSLPGHFFLFRRLPC